MDQVIEIFDGVRNVEFKELTHIEEVERELPVFTLTDIPAERWNSMAEKVNTKAFIEKFKRQPKDYTEVLEWVYSVIGEQMPAHRYRNKESHSAENTMAY